MATDLQPIVDGETVARVLLHGDLQKLTASQKVSYYKALCDSVGLNPLAQPFAYLVLNGREVLYAKREATEQLRRIHDVSITIVARELIDGGLYAVTARATLPSGRTDENIGAVSLEGLKGENRANALMKAETKAKRRVTLAICGLGLLDETEVADIPKSAMGAYDTVAAPPPVSAERERTLKQQLGVGPDDLIPAPDDDNLSRDDILPEGVVRVMRIDSAPTKNPNVTRYLVTLSTGETASTINQFTASLAQDYCEKGTPVRAELEPTQWGRPNLKKLTPADQPAPHPEPPPDASSIPF